MASPVTGNYRVLSVGTTRRATFASSTKGRNMLKTSTERTLNPALDRITVRFWSPGSWSIQKAFFLMFAVLGLTSSALAIDHSGATGRLEGTVFEGDQRHESCPVGAKVRVS